MKSDGLLAVCAAILAAAFTYLTIHVSLRRGLTQHPTLDRWHAHATPNTGGIAILLTCASLYPLIRPHAYGVIALASLAMALVGFWDDRFPLKPLVKLGSQALASAAVVGSGVVFHATPWFPANLAFTFLWIVGITNAFNLIDNMDGLCAGVVVIVSVFRFWSSVQIGDEAGALMSALLGGAFLGFLVFNFHPAKIFMGDCGSMFAGFSLAALAVASPLPNTRVFLSALFYPALTFLFPIFDTVLVSCLRRAAGRPISVGGRDHSSHRLASLGLSERTVVALLWILTAAGAAAGGLTYGKPVAAIVAMLFILALVLFGMFLRTLPRDRALRSTVRVAHQQSDAVNSRSA